MKNLILKGILIFIISVFSISDTNAQDLSQNEMEYEVYKVFPPISISKPNLILADSLVDLNKNFNSSWVKEFISVEIFTYQNGKIIKTESEDDVLTTEQKEKINQADDATKITVKVKYIPNNNLKFNDIKEINFSTTVNPDNDAVFEGGDEKIKQYFKEKVVDKIPESTFKLYQLAAVKFTIDEDGQVVDVHVFWSSENEEVDQLMVEAVCNMPKWKPAFYSSGLRVKQEYALTIGDMKSCVINMLNIREGWPE